MIKKRAKRRKSRRAKTGIYKSLSGTEYRYRSNWERLYMQYLDSRDDVVSWSYESVLIQYISNQKTGKKRNYKPDFLVECGDGTKQLIEVKPSKKIHQKKVVKKTLAAREWCNEKGIEFMFVTEVELKNLNLM